LDLQAIARFFSELCVSIGRGGVFVAMNRVQFVDAITPFIQKLQAKGYEHSEFANAETAMLNDTTALVPGVADRYGKDGVEIERHPISCLLHSSSDKWQIAVMILSE
jgi:hypothetical protein